MILIGENLNVMSHELSEAFKNKDKGPVQAMAEAEIAAGVDAIDLNIGPMSKSGGEFMKWLVSTVQETTDLMLSLDTMNMDAMEAGLAVSKNKILMNSISARPERLARLVPLAKKYGADFIGLALSSHGIPADNNERGLYAAEILAAAQAADISDERIWFDPLILPINTQQAHLIACTEFMSMVRDFAPGARTTGGLSNVSHGSPRHLRGILNRTYLIMLKRYGAYSAIVDAFDKELHAIARNERPELELLVHRVMDGQPIEEAKLEKEEAEYVKTANILLNRTLYSDSWLEV
ncbi:MAG TPA: dihydropteroate synthase [Syntrophorhabdaceae bacterium]|nr:dihydropteroate synthase [Syntrophorhabdaceae bacterium]